MAIGLTDILVALGNFPLLEDIFLKGGFRAVDNPEARDDIDPSMQKSGMLVWVESEGKLYQMAEGWVEVSLGPGNGSTNTVPVWSNPSNTLANSTDSIGAVRLGSSAGQNIIVQPTASLDAGGANVEVNGGAGGPTSNGGYALLYGGAGGETSGDGGNAYVAAGDATTEGHGGYVTINGGYAEGTDKNGGSVHLEGGLPTGLGSPGSISLQAAGNTSTVGGNVVLSVGEGSSAANDGTVLIATVGNSSRAARLQFLGSNTNPISIKAPATVTTYEMTLPSSQGGAGTVLTNDGSGGLTWSAGGGGMGDYQINASVTSPDATPLTVHTYTDPVNTDRAIICYDILATAIGPFGNRYASFKINAVFEMDAISEVIHPREVTYLNGPVRTNPAWNVQFDIVGADINLQVVGESNGTEGTRWRIVGFITRSGFTFSEA